MNVLKMEKKLAVLGCLVARKNCLTFGRRLRYTLPTTTFVGFTQR